MNVTPSLTIWAKNWKWHNRYLSHETYKRVMKRPQNFKIHTEQVKEIQDRCKIAQNTGQLL